MEPAAEMIVNSARRHFAQRVQVHRQRFVAFGRFIAIAGEDAEKKIQRRWSRKFWRITESAFTRIVVRAIVAQTPRRERPIRRPQFSLTRYFPHLVAPRLFLHPAPTIFAWFFFQARRDALQNFRKSRLTVTIFRRKICSADERLEDPA